MFTLDFLLRFVLFLIAVTVLLRVIYFRSSPNKQAYFGFFLFGNGVFFVTYLLHNVEMSMGFAFGLFAVFSMLRYRTESISLRDMTYLFIVIVVSMICAVAKLSVAETVAIIVLIWLLAFYGESRVFAPTIIEKHIVYDRVDNLGPENYAQLLFDLKNRTGMNVIKVEVGAINYLSDSAQLTLFCKANSKESV